MRSTVWTSQTNKTPDNMVIGSGPKVTQDWDGRNPNQPAVENVMEVVRIGLTEIQIPQEISPLVQLSLEVKVTPVVQTKGKIQIQRKGAQRCMTSEGVMGFRVKQVILLF